MISFVGIATDGVDVKNAKHHGFVKDFEDWPYMSYHSILAEEPTFLNKKWIVDLFGGKKSFIEFHSKK